MHEFGKLKARLKNIGKNTTEYRMTVSEAKALILEIETAIAANIQIIPEPVEQIEPQIVVRILDGGTF